MTTAVKIKPRRAAGPLPPPLLAPPSPDRQPARRRTRAVAPRTLLEDAPGRWLPALPPAAGTGPHADGFAALLQAYQSAGGIAHGELLAQQVEASERGAVSALARLIIARRILAFEWRNAWWVPLFQFQPGSVTVKTACQPIQAELAACLSRWSAAVWWASPNARLDGLRPVDVIQADPSAVLSAARMHVRPTACAPHDRR